MRLLNQQIEAITHLKEWKVGALFMEAGTGKTRVACELINKIDDVDDVLWIAPLRTIPGAKLEIKRWINPNISISYCGVESLSNSDRTYIELLDLVRTATNLFIVVDESLKIKNAEAKRTKRVLELGKYASYKLVLNGTPLSRNLLDLWSQMEFLSPMILNMDLNTFKDTFCCYTTITQMVGRHRGYKKEFITGYENIDSLHAMIAPYVYECNLELSIKQNYHDLKYTIDDKEKKEYYDLKQKYLSEETLVLKNNNIFMEMTQKMQHVYCITQSKFKIIDKLFEEIDEDKCIIFCKYIDSRKECEKRYKKSLVLSYQKEGYGLNLQSYRYTIYFDKIWDYALRIQSSRRTYRVGQEYNCQYYDLTGDVGLEKLIDSNIEKKISMSEYFKLKSIEDIRSEL